MWFNSNRSDPNNHDMQNSSYLSAKTSENKKNLENLVKLPNGLSETRKEEDDEDTIHDMKVLYGGEPCIVESHETNKWLVYNPNINFGYRTNYTNNKILLKSACACHNETGNVWTHGLGALIFMGVIFYCLFFWSPLRLEHS